MSEDGFSDCFDEPNMEIQIDTLTGTSFDMRVSSTDTIREIKQRIQRVEGIPIHQQNLIYQSKELKDSRRLCDAGIKNGSTIKLVLAMRGGPISTRRLSVNCEHHLVLKELKELLENSRDEIGNKLVSGSKVSVLFFKEGDILNLLRVIENEDGSYSPYSEKPISPPSCRSRQGEKLALFEKLVEDSDMMTKIASLKKKMEDVNLKRQSRHNNNKDEGQMKYKLLSNSDLLDNLDLKIFQKDEENHSEEEIALKDKHRIKARKPEGKSLYSENKGAFSHTKANYVRIHRKAKDLQPASQLENPSKVHQMNTVHLTRLVLDSTDKTPSPTLEIENDNQWEIHEPSDRLKHSTTCKVGLLKRRQSVDFGFDDKQDIGATSFSTTTTTTNDVCSNFYVPQFPVKNYKRSPLYGRKNTDIKKTDKLNENKTNFLNECSIERLKNDDCDLFSKHHEESIDELYGYYNFGLLSKNNNNDDDDYNDNNIVVNDDDNNKLPPVTIKKKSRCNECNKRLNITNIYNCRCGKIFCSQHRYSEVHRCNYDYKSEGKRILQHQNPLIAATKINRI